MYDRVMMLKTILEASGQVTVVATGTDGADAISLYREHRPDAKVLLLTTFSYDEYIVKALKLGAKGYLLNLITVLMI